jgi:anaerobic ribonucleoside-triphosphate reductase
MTCQEKVEVYSRVCGFFRPVQTWNVGKKAEFKDRKTYNVEDALAAAEDGGRI